MEDSVEEEYGCPLCKYKFWKDENSENVGVPNHKKDNSKNGFFCIGSSLPAKKTGRTTNDEEK
jgi:hypothetical protein